MRVKTPIVVLLIVLTLLLMIPVATPAVLATVGVPVSDPSNIWYPYGPSTANLQLHFYNGAGDELQSFEAGQLDVVSSGVGVPLTSWPSYSANPDFMLSPVQGQSGKFGIYFNMMSDRFKAWGCDWANGNSQCGIDIREAFAHLMDRQQLVIDGPLAGGGQALADPSLPFDSPPGSPLATQCSWDSIAPYHNNCTFAFHVGPNPCPGGFCTDPSEPDFCAAVNYLLQANTDSGGALGLARDNAAPIDPTSGLSCGIDPNSPGLSNIAAHPMLGKIRNNDEGRLYMGTGFMNAVNTLFTRPVVQPQFGTIAAFRPTVFRDGLLGGAAQWDFYTQGNSALGPFAVLYPFYNSVFASNFCGGRQILSPTNNMFDCVASLDADTLAAENSLDIPSFEAATLRALNDFGAHALELPAYTFGVRTAALKSVAGLVNSLGQGYDNFYTLLSAHQGSYIPVNEKYAFGGGDPTTLRYGLQSGIDSLNIFRCSDCFFTDAQTVSEVYDPLFISNPVDPGQIMCWICDNYSQVVDASGNTHFDLELRQGLRWHDGAPVTAHDVAFSLYNERDFSNGPAVQLNGLMLNQTSVLSNTELDIVMAGASFFWLVYLEYPLVVPSHIWELRNGPGSAGTPQGYSPDHSVGIVDPAKLYLNYDPMTSHTLIGSGPFACVDLTTGVIGGGCATNANGTPAGQAIGAGGTMLLARYDFTSSSSDPFNQWTRSYNLAWGTGSGVTAHSGQFQEFRWADRFNNDTVTLRDLAQVAACSGARSLTAACPASDSLGPVFDHWHKPSFETNGAIGPEVAIVASHIDDTWVSPFSWSGDQAAQPGQNLTQIVPWH